MDQLSPGIATELAAHRTGLSLVGLSCLSDAAAAILAEHGPLCLCCWNLTTMSQTAARALAQHKGPLTLFYSEKLPAPAAEILRSHIMTSADD